MIKALKMKKLTGLLLVAAMFGFAFACAQQTKKDQADSAMVITFVQGDAKVIQAASGKEAQAKIGMVVREADLIKTTAGSVDLQTRNGSAIRVSEFTEVTVAKLSGGENGATRFDMKQGGILATVSKKSSGETFDVVTPTAVAGVRGTTFSVDVQEGQQPRVRVVEGKVAMSARIPALEKISEEAISSNETLKKLADMQKNSEIVLEDNTEGTLNSEIEKQVVEVNEVLTVALAEAAKEEGLLSEEAAAEADKPAKSVAEQERKLASLGDISKLDVKSIQEKVEKGVAEKPEMKKAIEAPATVKAVETKEAAFTAQEKMEQQTLITVDDEVLSKIIEEEGSANVASSVENLKEVRAKQEEVVLKKIEEVAAKEELKSEDEIKQRYNKLELITLKSGEKISGAVIAQTGSLMVIHSADGVKRVQKGDVESQEFLY